MSRSKVYTRNAPTPGAPYAQAIKAGAFGTAKLAPSNLCQIFTYLRQRSVEPGWE